MIALYNDCVIIVSRVKEKHQVAVEDGTDRRDSSHPKHQLSVKCSLHKNL